MKSYAFLKILFFIFLTLKLMGFICWSWVWITCPIWIPMAFTLGIHALEGFLIGVQEGKGKRK